MKRPGRVLWRLALLVAIGGAIYGAYRLGYEDGLHDRGPQRRALVGMRRDAANPGASGQQVTWFDISKPEEAKGLREAEERLKAAGAEYYVVGAKVETTVSPEPDPRRANSHR